MSVSLPEPIVAVRALHHTYGPASARPIHALQGIDLDVYPGDYLVIVGHNGSGKSTLARHLNALLRPTAGEVRVAGLDTRDPAHELAIRSTVGIVFQVPDNQIVATVVEEDVAFGPENLGVPRDELLARVDWALDVVDLQAERRRAPHRLSAGQKQRVAIAGVLAMRPAVLVLDEATAMLDPEARAAVLRTVRALNDQGVTVIAITHFMDEAVHGSRVAVMDAGRVVLQGTPREVFSHFRRLRDLGLDVPQVTELAHALRERVPDFAADLLTVDELAAEIVRHVRLEVAL
ncbi:MAG TPA: energy-coupling factor transporter ATPase [Anaerolineae bacterium]|nr:energy-coupling factor transporter ATPase [Anaerolineae bacterium]